jgi:hypothetical protein
MILHPKICLFSLILCILSVILCIIIYFRYSITSNNCSKRGEKGDTGKMGLKGESIKGDCGSTGEKGDRGQTGEKGDRGSTGEKGDRGPRGECGSIGPIGPIGEKGKCGLTGKKGDRGLRGRNALLSSVPFVTIDNLEYMLIDVECFTSHNQQLLFQGHITINDNVLFNTITSTNSIEIGKTTDIYVSLLNNTKAICHCYNMYTHEIIGTISYIFSTRTLLISVYNNIDTQNISHVYFELRTMIDDKE